MAKSWNRTETWLTLIAVAVGVLLTSLLGLLGYVIATAPLHTDPESVPSVAGAGAPGEWTDAVDRGRRIMREGLTGQNVPGLSVAVGIDGDVVWAEGFGWADLDRRVPVAPQTKFRIGTASKALTSAAVGLLLQEDRLELDAPIHAYVPQFPVKEWPVTLRQLMGQTAGVVNDGGDEGPLLSERCERPVDALPHFAGRALLFEPGSDYRPSSYGWILVSAAIESAADEPFPAFMERRVFEPLGMIDTRLDSMSEADPDRATAYFPRLAADPRYGLHPTRPLDYSCYAGASAFLSTPTDLVRFGMAIDGGGLLQPETVRMLQTSQRLSSGRETGYGLGWEVRTGMLAGSPAMVAGHDGESLGGRVASLVTFPGRGIVVAVTSNIAYADTSTLAADVAQEFARLADDGARR